MNSPAPCIGTGTPSGFDIRAPLCLPRGSSPRNSLTMAHAIGCALRLIAFADLLGRAPTATEIAAQFRIGRATAYRWRDAFTSYYGQEGATS